MVTMLEKSKLLSDNVEAKERTRIPSSSTSQCCFKTPKTNDKSLSILFEFKDATIIKSFDYINLHSKHYDRNIGIILFYTNATVIIYGTHLDKLFLELNAANVASINEHHHKPVANDEVKDIKQSIVKSIEVQYKDPEQQAAILGLENKAFQEYDEAGVTTKKVKTRSLHRNFSDTEMREQSPLTSK